MGDAVVPFGDWLTRWLDREGWSVPEFARRANVPPQTAYRWAKNERVPKPQYWPRIAHALGVSEATVASAAAGLRLGTSRPDPLELQRLLAAERSANLRYAEEVSAVPRGVSVPIEGYIPADTFRWTTHDRQGTVDILESDLKGARSAYALIATGDCMMRIGIVSGTIVILDRPDGRMPSDGQIVAVRVNQDQYTLKRWVMVDGHPELHDGDGQLVYRLNPLDDVDVIGFYITHKPGPGS